MPTLPQLVKFLGYQYQPAWQQMYAKTSYLCGQGRGPHLLCRLCRNKLDKHGPLEGVPGGRVLAEAQAAGGLGAGCKEVVELVECRVNGEGGSVDTAGVNVSGGGVQVAQQLYTRAGWGRAQSQ